ncbi:MAG: hypothetical protein IJ491_04790 [Clostridia bacterium]|nr:hypothetical protein [Clostridia bacterium]
MLKEKQKSGYVFYAISVIALVSFAVLAYFFPYTGDDWAWGSQMGIDRLKTFFDAYNGRYLGNLLVLAVTRSKLLDSVVMAVSYYLACYICYKFTPFKKNTALLMALALFFSMPRYMFLQSVVWTAGFSNYVPSAIISAGYLIIVKNITYKRAPEYHKFLFPVTFLMGVCGALFIENITLFNICLGVAVIFYTGIKFRKVYPAHVSFFIGSVSGALIMFSNSSYRNIAKGADGYRTTASTAEDTMLMIEEHFHSIMENTVISNCLLCIVISVLLVALTVRFVKNSDNKVKNAVSVISATTNVICAALIFLTDYFNHNEVVGYSFGYMLEDKYQNKLALIFIVTLVIISVLCIEKGYKFRIMLPACCVPVVVAPLLVVNPIGPRCFFVSYLFTMMFAVALFGYVTRDIKINSFNYKAAFYGLVVVVLVQLYFYIGIFHPVHVYDQKRNEFVQYQLEQGKKTVVVCDLPNKYYLWVSYLTDELWSERYKLFHKIDSDVQFKNVSIQEFDKLYAEYEKQKEN